MGNQNRRESEDIAGRVCGAVSEILESLELGQLNQAVKERAGSALEEAKRQMEQCRMKAEDALWRRQEVSGTSQTVSPKPVEIRVNWKGRVSGILFIVFGAVGSGVFGVVAGVLLLFTALSLTNPAGWWLAGVSGAIALGFGIMLGKGIGQNGRISRLKNYIKELKYRNKSYCEVEELSRSCGRKKKFVQKDLKKIIAMGMLPDARLDEEALWLMLDEETYEQYRLSKQALRERENSKNGSSRDGGPGRQSRGRRRWFRRQTQPVTNEECPKDQKAGPGRKEEDREQGAEADGAGSREGWEKPQPETKLDAAIRQGERYMEALDSLREAMPGEPVREKLLRLDRVLGLLFEGLRKHPEQLDDMERFMEYYLPTTVKMVSAYKEFAAVEFPGENINGAKAEIEQALDTINGAFEKMLDDLYEDAAFDIITDASVLKTMLAKEGMTEPDFKTDNKER